MAELGASRFGHYNNPGTHYTRSNQNSRDGPGTVIQHKHELAFTKCVPCAHTKPGAEITETTP